MSGLRKKDVALLVYLCVEGTTVHPRGRLAALLWGDKAERRARHSLTQALGRLNRTAAAEVVAVGKDVVRCAPGVQCDAVALLRGGMDGAEVDDEFSLYPGPFLEGFDAGPGAEEFHAWADRCRGELRNAALRLLDRAGEQAAAAGEWRRALRLAERAIAIDPVWEEGHRRVMRAQAARGERNRALRHYQVFETWLAAEVGAEPDPETRALAEQLRASDAPALPPDPARPAAPSGRWSPPLRSGGRIRRTGRRRGPPPLQWTLRPWRWHSRPRRGDRVAGRPGFAATARVRRSPGSSARWPPSLWRC